MASAVAVALDNSLVHEEVRQLRDRLAAEKVYLQEEIRTEHNFEEIVGTSVAIKKVFRANSRCAWLLAILATPKSSSIYSRIPSNGSVELKMNATEAFPSRR